MSAYPTLSEINVEDALERVRQQLKEDRTISPSRRAAIDVLMLLVKLLAERFAAPRSPDPAQGAGVSRHRR